MNYKKEIPTFGRSAACSSTLSGNESFKCNVLLGHCLETCGGRGRIAIYTEIYIYTTKRGKLVSDWGEQLCKTVLQSAFLIQGRSSFHSFHTTAVSSLVYQKKKKKTDSPQFLS